MMPAKLQAGDMVRSTRQMSRNDKVKNYFKTPRKIVRSQSVDHGGMQKSNIRKFYVVEGMKGTGFYSFELRKTKV